MSTFASFTDDVLVALYHVSRKYDEPQFIPAGESFQRLTYQRSEHDKWEALNELDERGYIKALNELGIDAAGRAVMILGPGIIRSEEIIAERTPKSFARKLADIPRSDWIALGALLISLFALFR
jgi:hypothetical protein